MTSQHKKSLKRILVLMGLTVTVVSFQNCGGFDAASVNELVNQSSLGGSSDVKLAWDRTTSNEDGSPASILGYKLYIGTSSEDYSTTISERTIGNSNEYRLTGLVSGETYYISVAAVSTDGTESAKSSEISYTVPNN